MADDEKTTSRIALFAEHQQAQSSIAALCDVAAASVSQRNQWLAKLRRIYDKYLECPTLLDPYLEEMVQVLSSCALRDLGKDDEASPFPHVMSALYSLCKVRGYKRVQRFFPHEAHIVEPVLRALFRLEEASSSTTQESSAESGPMQWESLYVLWVWIGKLSLVPFDYTVVSDDSLFQSLFVLGRSHLSHAGPTRETASSCLALWMSRPDLRKERLSFIGWSRNVLLEFGHPSQTSNIFITMGAIQTLANLVKVSTDRSNEDMEPLWEPALVVAENAGNGAMLLRKLLVKWFARMGCAYLPPRVASWRYERGRRSLLENMGRQHQSRTGSTINNSSAPHTTSRVANNELFVVPDQVEDAMGFLLQSLTDSSTVVRWSAAKGIGRMTERLPSICADDVLDAILNLKKDPEKDHAWHGMCLALAELARRGLLLPSRLGDVVPVVLQALQFDVHRGHSSAGANVRDAACYTNWAFARAYAPEVLRPFIPGLSRSLVLTSLFDREVNCRRAASAAFQECVGRQGADKFKHGISILTSADYYSLGNRKHAYTTVAICIAQFQEYRNTIIAHLYKLKLRHWDPSIRILASKSLNKIAPLDIGLMTKEVIPFLIEQSTNENLFVRHGAALGLAEIILSVSECKEENRDAALGNDNVVLVGELVPTIEKARLYRGRGGELMRSAVCRLIECISRARLGLTVKQQVRLLDSVDACLKHPSEDIQEAASHALYSLTRSYFPVNANGPSERLQKRIVDSYIHFVSTSVNPAETRGYAMALGMLPRKLLAPSSSVLTCVIDCLCKAARHDSKVGDEADAETRRNAIAALSQVCSEVGIHGGYLSSPQATFPCVSLSRKQVVQVFESFLLSLEDYNTDRRGDVGSWSRIAAMSGLEILTYAAVHVERHEDPHTPQATVFLNDEDVPNSDENVDAGNSQQRSLCEAVDGKENHITHLQQHVYYYFDESLCIRIFGGMLKQLAEKLDSVRAHAGRCLERMLTKDSPIIPFIPKRDRLLQALRLKPTRTSTNWANGNETFGVVMAAADIDAFFYAIISGMVVSVGSLGGNVSKPAEEALLAWLRSDDTELRAAQLAEALLKVFQSHKKIRRVTLPLLKAIDVLLNHGCLNTVVHTDTSTFPVSLLASLKLEATRCTDVHRLLSIVSVSLGLLRPMQQNNVNEDILVFVFRMLGHPFPRIRRFTADHLYVRLVEDADVLPSQENLDVAIELLLEGQWDADMKREEVRDMRNRVAELVGVELPSVGEAQPNSKTSAAQSSTVRDEFASYASLVNDAIRN